VLPELYNDVERRLGPQILVTDNDSQYLTNWIAVFLGLSIPCVFIILRRMALAIIPLFWSLISYVSDSVARRERDPAAPNGLPQVLQETVEQLQIPEDEDNPLKAIMMIGANINSVSLDHNNIINQQPVVSQNNPEPPSLGQGILNTFKNIGLAVQKMWNDKILFFAVSCVVTYFAALFFSGAYVSVISAGIANNNVLSSMSPAAGLWESDISSAAYLLGDGAAINDDRQARTWNYKTGCYDMEDNNPGCNIFYEQRIPYQSFSNTSCPFNGDACMLGRYSAFTAETTLLDSNILGINAPDSKRFFFQRSMTCAPLHMDKRYVDHTGDIDYPNQWLYNYGPFKSGAYVFDDYTYRNAREWSLVSAHLNDIQDYVLA
jgi:hypothetical protein